MGFAHAWSRHLDKLLTIDTRATYMSGARSEPSKKRSLLHVDRYLSFSEADLCELDKYTSRYRVTCSIVCMLRPKQGVVTSAANVVSLDIMGKMPDQCMLRVH